MTTIDEALLWANDDDPDLSIGSASQHVKALASEVERLRVQRCETCQYASDGDIGLWCEKWSPAIPSSRDVMCADIKGCGAWHGGCRKGE